jgi:hypothetical protein
MLIFLLISLMNIAQAKFDLSYGLHGRTLPALGAEIYADTGYSQLLWGKKENPSDFKYGLIRPALQVSSSGVINSARAELEFYPLSIIGFSVARQYQNSNYDFPFFNCEQVTCKGEYIRNSAETKMVLGYRGFVAVGNYKIETVRSPSKDLPMADWRNVILGEPGEEVQQDKRLILAYLWNHHMAGLLLENTLFEGSRERKESYVAIYQIRKEQTSYLLGAGLFKTDQEPQGLIFYFRIHHLKLPSLKLF